MRNRQIEKKNTKYKTSDESRTFSIHSIAIYKVDVQIFILLRIQTLILNIQCGITLTITKYDVYVYVSYSTDAIVNAARLAIIYVPEFVHIAQKLIRAQIYIYTTRMSRRK